MVEAALRSIVKIISKSSSIKVREGRGSGGGASSRYFKALREGA
jgi:hypothetical protein